MVNNTIVKCTWKSAVSAAAIHLPCQPMIQNASWVNDGLAWRTNLEQLLAKSLPDINDPHAISSYRNGKQLKNGAQILTYTIPKETRVI